MDEPAARRERARGEFVLDFFEKSSWLRALREKRREVEEDRKRLITLFSPAFDRFDETLRTENKAELNNVSYIDLGRRIDEIDAEIKNLTAEIIEIIEAAVPDDTINGVYQRRLVKLYYADGVNVKDAVRLHGIYINYRAALRLFALGRESIVKYEKSTPKYTGIH